MLNMTTLLKHIKRELGILAWRLPIDDSEIIDIIKEEVLRPFSEYHQLVFPITVDFSSSLYDKVNKIYTIPHTLIPEGSEILGVKRFNNINNNDVNFSVYKTTNIHSANILDILTDNVIGNMYDSIPTPSITHKFIHPNKIEFFNIDQSFGMNNIGVELFITHPNLSTIPSTVERFFNKLATKIVQKYLYKIMQHMDRIETIYGTIDLKIDAWADAESQVDELFQQLEEDALLLPQYEKIHYIGR